MEISASDVKKLREITGAGMMDCKKALQENNGDIEKSIEYLRKKGLLKAAEKSSRIAAQGIVDAYIHSNNKIGVLIEVNSETDFVARNPEFKEFVHNLCLHIAASAPEFINTSDIPAAIIEKEKEIYLEQFKNSGKPANVIENIVQGKIEKEFYKAKCLMEQDYVKDPSITIKTLLTNLIAKLGENIVIRRFVRWQVGEGIEKKEENFAEEVKKQIEASQKK
ncbi:MAG TPA: translation elongation factor Ts [bacterium]|nr:translation elongation factor Ts [bacterium]HOL46889.1 translation elongation factor Ts [bacterium]HPQ18762.1 translation elongation factor Ts [bacterium]